VQRRGFESSHTKRPPLTAASVIDAPRVRPNRLRRAATFAADGRKHAAAAVGGAFFDKSRTPALVAAFGAADLSPRGRSDGRSWERRRVCSRGMRARRNENSFWSFVHLQLPASEDDVESRRHDHEGRRPSY